ncbi:hypothetical protein BCR34DRAFT_585005 [Clohesyomyces aquaticus]|uniref:Uncharacterized protein n=1 Tax=Clohesyomyces aquaticus TaxID=1231657 RepID=A0A1Y1ZZG1_9PLEO|nr:hypothetical protein BCR34DRAFT_585005 [Clohesyomyces aquaticus]
MVHGRGAGFMHTPQLGLGSNALGQVLVFEAFAWLLTVRSRRLKLEEKRSSPGWRQLRWPVRKPRRQAPSTQISHMEKHLQRITLNLPLGYPPSDVPDRWKSDLHWQPRLLDGRGPRWVSISFVITNGISF